MEFIGYNGTINTDDASLTITHSGMTARAAGLARDMPRRIPLPAVSDVRLKPATRLMNGYITLGLGGAKAVDVGTQGAANAETLLFRHKENDAFERLHAWLLTVIQLNQNSGLDQSEVQFDAAGKAIQQTEKMSKMLGDDRPDIVAAAARMGWRMGGKRELKQLAGHLYDNETVRSIAQGTFQDDQGIVVLTDTRLLFLFHGVVRQAKEDFPLRLISSVQTKSGFGTGELRITVSGASSSISGILKTDLEPLADAIRQGMTAQSAVPAQPAAPAQPSGPDALDQLRKLADLHAAGILTDEEFNAKKAQLLERM